VKISPASDFCADDETNGQESQQRESHDHNLRSGWVPVPATHEDQKDCQWSRRLDQAQ
jgi:hypothetical protein